MGVWVFPEPGLLSQCLCAMPWIVPAGSNWQLSHPPAWPGLALSPFLLPVLPPSSLWGQAESGAERLFANHCLAEKCISRAGFIMLAWHCCQALARDQDSVAKPEWSNGLGYISLPPHPEMWDVGPSEVWQALGRCSLSCTPFPAPRLPGTS